MNKKVFIKQDGTIPGHRIINELIRRGGICTALLGRGNYYYIAIDFIICTLDKEPEGYTELLYNKETDSFFEKSQRMVSAEAKETPLGWKDSWLSSMLKNANNNLCLTIPEGYEAKIEDGKVIISKKLKLEKGNYYVAIESWSDDGWTKFQKGDVCKCHQDNYLIDCYNIPHYFGNKAGLYFRLAKDDEIPKERQPEEGDTVYIVKLYADDLYFYAEHYTLYEDIPQTLFDDFLKQGTVFQYEDQAHAFCRKLNNAIRQVAEERRKEVEG